MAHMRAARDATMESARAAGVLAFYRAIFSGAGECVRGGLKCAGRCVVRE
jgi:hypothetical protein